MEFILPTAEAFLFSKGFMEGSGNYFLLLLTGELVEVYGIARNSDGEVGVRLGILIRLHKHLAVKHVYVDVVRLLCKISVKYIDTGCEVASCGNGPSSA